MNNNNKTQLGYNLDNLVANYRIFLQSVIKLRPISIKNYISDLRFFFGWLNNETHVIELNLITSDTINLYKNFLIESELPHKTVNRRLSSLRSFFKYAINQSLIESNPAKQVQNLPSTLFHSPEQRELNVVQGNVKSLSVNSSELNEFIKYLSACSINHDSEDAISDINEFLEYTQ